MKSPMPMIKPLVLSGTLLLGPMALAQEGDVDRDAIRAELETARAELAEAARNMAQLQRQLIDVDEADGRWQMKMDGDDENVEIIIESDSVFIDENRDVHFFGATPKLGILVSGTGSDNEVLGLTPGGGAEAAGLKRGDRVTSVNGIGLDAETSIANALDGVEAGDAVAVVVERDGETLDFEVETSAPERDVRIFAQRFGAGEDFDFDIDMDALHEGLEAAERQIVIMHEQGLIPPNAPNAPHPPRLPGLFVLGSNSDLISNHDGLAPYFGTGDGVVVLRIAEDNALQLQDGDVILSIDGEAVNRPVELGRAMIDRQAGETVILEVMRNGTLTQLEGSVPESTLPGLHIKRGLGMRAPAPVPPPHPAVPPRPPRLPAELH